MRDARPWGVAHSAMLLGADLARHAVTMTESGVRAVEAMLPFGEEQARESPGVARTMRGLLDRTGLPVWSVHSFFMEHADFSVADRIERSRALDTHRYALDVCAALGASVLVVHASGPLDGLPEDPARGRALAGVATLAEDAAAARLVLAVENLPHNYVCPGGEELRLFVDEVSNPSVRACLDTGHAHLTDGVVPAARALAGRIASIHAHDNRGRADDHLLPGWGSIDWAPFGATLRDTDYTGPIVLELALPGGETAESMVEAFWSAVRI